MGNIPEIWFTVSSTIVTCVLGMLGSLKLFDLRLNRMIKKYGKRYLPYTAVNFNTGFIIL